MLLLYWPHPSALVANNGGTDVGHGPVKIKVAMGCHTEPAFAHSAHVMQHLHFFQFFNLLIIISATYRQKKITRIHCKKN